MKASVLPMFTFLLLRAISSDGLQARPENVPKEAQWITNPGMEQFDHWILEETKRGVKFYTSWKKDGKLLLRSITYGTFTKMYEYTPEGELWAKNQTRKLIDEAMRPSPQYTSHKYGKSTYFLRGGKIAGESCYTISNIKPADLPPILDHTPALTSYPCGESWGLNTKTLALKRETHPDKCLQGCGEFKPFMPPGKYKVHATNVILRDKPSTKGKSLGTLAKGTELQVIEDTHKIETHDFETAPWVKVRLTPSPSPKGEGSRQEQIGYVFGGFLDSLERNDL